MKDFISFDSGFDLCAITLVSTSHNELKMGKMGQKILCELVEYWLHDYLHQRLKSRFSTKPFIIP